VNDSKNMTMTYSVDDVTPTRNVHS